MTEDTKFTTAQVLSWIAGQKDKALRFINGTKDDMSVVLASKTDLASVITYFANENSDEDTQDAVKALAAAALEVRHAAYGNRVFFRGLIEFTNYCKNDCYYCGIGRSQSQVHRYRLSDEEILSCCRTGEKLGYHSFVLQGGEDPYYTDDRMCAIIRMIRGAYPNTAITLSVGEKSHESYLKYFEAGANRYLLRHETATDEHYRLLHPEEMSLSHRKDCLHDLMNIGYQVGAGFMVGSPFQTPENLAADLVFLQELVPHMVGIGPFIPSSGTRFAGFPAGSLHQTLVMLALTRLLLPEVLLPSTTALGTIDPLGREKGFGYGANVVMPNLSPTSVRADYALYDNKICTGDDAVDCQKCLNGRILRSGNMPDYTRGDHRDFVPEDIQPSGIV
ncbi:MAG: [FeFe] hydrogenase H-cluster radical SAM maturase HydE [Eubacteriales bacterium]